MAYRVSITPRAERDLSDLYHLIDAEGSATALDWYRKLKEAILSLNEHPDRCSTIPEDNQLRHLTYGNKPHIYRVLTARREVQVLHIRHGARRPLKASSIR